MYIMSDDQQGSRLQQKTWRRLCAKFENSKKVENSISVKTNLGNKERPNVHVFAYTYNNQYKKTPVTWCPLSAAIVKSEVHIV